MNKVLLSFLFIWMWIPYTVTAQELNCKVTVDFKQIQGTNTEVFQSLETSITSFMNERTWTNDQYTSNERISCALLLTVTSYSDDGSFNETIKVDERGNYTFAVQNNSSKAVSVSGYVNY